MNEVCQRVQSCGHLPEGRVTGHTWQAGSGLTLQCRDVRLGPPQCQDCPLQVLETPLVTEHGDNRNVACDCLTKRAQDFSSGASLIATNTVLNVG